MIKPQADGINGRETARDLQDAEADKQEEQRSNKEENQEQQRVALSASLPAREVALER